MYETYTGMTTDNIMRLVKSYQRDFHIAVNPQRYRDDPAVLPPDSLYAHFIDANGPRFNYWSDEMQTLMARSVPRVESLLDEAFIRSQRGDLSIRDEIHVQSLASDVAIYLDNLMEGDPTSLGDILIKANEMCYRLNI